MKTQLIISDLTRMQEQRVCVAGYAEDGRCIRPILPPPGIQECSLFASGRPVIFPFAIVEYDLIRATPLPPHTEDYLFDPAAVRAGGALETGRRRDFLCQTLSPNVAAIFEQPVHVDGGFYLLDRSGPRSLGTIRPQGSVQVHAQIEANTAIKLRLSFADSGGADYKLAVTDLAWRYYADFLRRSEPLGEEGLATRLGAALRNKEVLLRIGLARGWSQHPDRCYLQITGIYTFPDCLTGRTFADFAPTTEEDDW